MLNKRIKKIFNELLIAIKYNGNMLISRFYIIQNGRVEEVFYKNKKIKLYLSEYNCGTNYNKRLTERSLELALAKEWVSALEGNYIEIGAVTPYYGVDFTNHFVIDPADLHEKVDLRKSLFEYEYCGKNVLSISTIEHVGTGDYGLSEKEDCLMAVNKILSESETCFISFPMGYNKRLDSYVMGEEIYCQFGQVSICVYVRNKFGNDWIELKNPQRHYTEHPYGPLWANCVCFIEKFKSAV